MQRKDLCQREPRGQYRADGLCSGIALGLGTPSVHPAVPEDRPRSLYALTRDTVVLAVDACCSTPRRRSAWRRVRQPVAAVAAARRDAHVLGPAGGAAMSGRPLVRRRRAIVTGAAEGPRPRVRRRPSPKLAPTLPCATSIRRSRSSPRELAGHGVRALRAGRRRRRPRRGRAPSSSGAAERARRARPRRQQRRRHPDARRRPPTRWEQAVDDFRCMVDVNLGGTYLVGRAAIPHLVEPAAATSSTSRRTTSTRAATRSTSTTPMPGRARGRRSVGRRSVGRASTSTTPRSGASRA